MHSGPARPGPVGRRANWRSGEGSLSAVAAPFVLIIATSKGVDDRASTPTRSSRSVPPCRPACSRLEPRVRR